MASHLPPGGVTEDVSADLSLDSHDGLQRLRHARFFKPGIVYHVVCKTLQGFFLLAPDRDGELRDLTAGVIGKAQRNWPDVRLYAAAFLSNHFHCMLEGPAAHVVPFIAFVKRELSRRWAARIGWSGPMWGAYHTTALITPEAQARCFKYVLSQSVKENAVANPTEWPGFHCAAALLQDRRATGTWFNATRYGKAVHKEKAKQTPRPVNRRQFVETYEVTFAKLPGCGVLSDGDYREHVRHIIDEIVEEARAAREGREPDGVAGVFDIGHMRRGEAPVPPWFEDRRRLIAWDSPHAPEVKAYLDEYWVFQRAFREAADRWLGGELDVSFPPGSFRPGLPRPVSQDRLAA